MPETPKNKPVREEEKLEKSVPSTWEDDQKRREYYYDDAHGYENYDPESEDEDEERTTQS